MNADALAFVAGQMITGFYFFIRDIFRGAVCVLTVTIACSAALARRGQIRRHYIVLSVLLFPLARLCAVGDLLRAIGLHLRRILLGAGELGAGGHVIFPWPVLDFLLHRSSAVSRIRVIAQ